MIDLRRLRVDTEAVVAAMARRGVARAELDAVLALDAQARELGARRDAIRTEIKELSRQVGAARRDGDADAAEQAARRSRELGTEESSLAHQADELAQQVRERLLRLPNLPAPDAPAGASEHDNVVARRWGSITEYQDHQGVPHWEIGAELGILDLERGAKISGSMFPMYRGEGAALVRALVSFALDLNRDAFEEIRPPTLVRTDTMIATGHLPKFEEEAYAIERDSLWAIPTAEVPLTSLARDEILPWESLPLRVMAHTSCFRREAGAAGRDTRGLLRVHEFDKVEILAYCAPEQAAEVHADLVARAEAPLRALGLSYRVLDLCAGDLGNSSARTFDLEVYAPGVQRWLEVSSISWFTDYQARRANIRYRRADSSVDAVHTLNGSGLAVPRVWAAVVEQWRQPDGSVMIPPPLRPYMGGRESITARS